MPVNHRYSKGNLTPSSPSCKSPILICTLGEIEPLWAESGSPQYNILTIRPEIKPETNPEPDPEPNPDSEHEPKRCGTSPLQAEKSKHFFNRL